MMHILHDRCMKDKQRENKILGNTNNENLVFMSNILEVQAVKKSKEIIM